LRGKGGSQIRKKATESFIEAIYRNPYETPLDGCGRRVPIIRRAKWWFTRRRAKPGDAIEKKRGFRTLWGETGNSAQGTDTENPCSVTTVAEPEPRKKKEFATTRVKKKEGGDFPFHSETTKEEGSATLLRGNHLWGQSKLRSPMPEGGRESNQ